MIPVDGKVVGRTVELKNGYTVPEGATVEGWALDEVEIVAPKGPLGAEEARELLGPEVVIACTRRGINLSRLDWNLWVEGPFEPTTWYKVIPGLDYRDPWDTWLPLFAHLLRSVQTDPGSLWLHIGDIQVVTEGLLQRKRPGATAENARLIALLLLRIVEVCGVSGRVGPHDLLEIHDEAHMIIQGCLMLEDRLGYQSD